METARYQAVSEDVELSAVQLPVYPLFDSFFVAVVEPRCPRFGGVLQEYADECGPV